MPKINVYLPDDLADAVRDIGVPVSAVCQRALSDAVRRITMIRQIALDDLGPDGRGPTDQLRLFTQRTTTIIGLAVTRARDDRAPNVGTGHLLHALLAEEHNLALQVLVAMEIEPRQLAAALARETAVEPGGGGDGLHFSTAAATALELTVVEALAFGHNYVGSEHLLLGLGAESDGIAGRVLRAAGADPRSTRKPVTAALAGYAHLSAQSKAGSDQPSALAAVQAMIRQEVQPLADRLDLLEPRLDRLEQHAGA